MSGTISTMQRVDNRSLLQSLALGLVASLLALTSLIGIVYAGFMVVALFYGLVDSLARAQAAGTTVLTMPLSHVLWQSLVTTGRNGWQGLMEARFAYVAFALLGLFAAAGWFFGGYTPRARRWGFSFGGMTAVVVITGVAWAVLQRDQILIWIAESPELYRWRDVLQRSLLTDVFVVSICGVLISIPVWMSWRWWFEQIALREKRRAPDTPHVLPSALAEHRLQPAQAQEREDSPTTIHDDPYVRLLLSRTFLIPAITVFGVLLLVVGVANARYKASTLRLTHDAFVLSTVEPTHEVALAIAADARQIRIVNINGQGTVSIMLRAADSPASVVAQVVDWTFQRRARQDYYYQEIPLHLIPAGQYLLSFQQHEGWGWYEYLLSQGSTQSSTALSITLGIALATTVLLGGLLLVCVVLAVHNRHNRRA